MSTFDCAAEVLNFIEKFQPALSRMTKCHLIDKSKIKSIKKRKKERLVLITASKYRGNTAQRSRTESTYTCPWLPLYGSCMTSYHSVKEGRKPVYPEKNSGSHIEMGKSLPTCGPRELILGHRGGITSASDDHYANLTPLKEPGAYNLYKII